MWGLEDASAIWGQMPFFFPLEEEENGENGEGVPCFWALGCSRMSWSRALQLVSLRPSQMGPSSGGRRRGNFRRGDIGWRTVGQGNYCYYYYYLLPFLSTPALLPARKETPH